MAARSADTKQLLLQVDASVELAKRNLASLQAQVATDSAKMDASLGRIDKASAGVTAAFGKMAAAGAGLVAAVSFGAAVSLGRDILTFADDLGTAADQAGVSVERFQTLREAFRALEIDTESVDQLLKRLQTTLGDVQSGAENGATAALDRLGISADVMSGKISSSDQLLDALAASATRAGTQAQFTADLADIVGRKLGPDLAAAIGDGGAALHDLEKQMRDSGTVIDSALIKRLADANEKLDAFQASAKRNMVLAAGHIFDFADDAEIAIGALGAMFDGPTDEWREAIRSFVVGAQDDMISLSGAISRVLGMYDSIENTRRKVDNAWEKGWERVTFGAYRATPLKPSREREEWDARVRAGQQAKALERVMGGDPLADFGRRVPSIREPSSGGGGRSRGGGSRARPAAKKPEALPADLREMANWDLPVTITLEADKALSDLSQIREDFSWLDGAQVDLSNVVTVADLERLNYFKEDMADVAAAAVRTGLGLEDWTLDDFADRLKDLVLQLTVVEPIVERIRLSMAGWSVGGGAGGGGFLGKLAGLGASIFGGGGSAGASTGFNFLGGADPASIFGPMFGGFRAAGGPVDAGKAYVVGERRAELFVPRVPGRIIPSVGGAGHTTNVSLNIHAPGATAETVAMIRRELAGAVPAIVQASKQATIGALQRPGLS